MQHFSSRNDRLSTRSVFLIIFYFSSALMLCICFFGAYASAQQYMKTGRLVIGEVLVKTEFPFHGFPKLVTYLMVTSVLSWFSGIKLGEDKIQNIPISTKSILQLLVVAVALIALYEFVYNFILWNSFVTNNAVKGIYQLDRISVPYPNPKTPWNLLFATKMTFAAFLISAHAFYILSKSNANDRKKL